VVSTQLDVISPATSNSPSVPKSGIEPEQWLEAHGDYLLRFAISKVSSSQIAEDLVSETVLAAMRGLDRFQGRSTERTWLTSILKNKVADHFRKKNRERSFTDLGVEEEWQEERLLAAADGAPARNPAESFEASELGRALLDSIDTLPDRAAEIFRLRAVEEVSTAEICQRFGISDSNFWVIMHRARAALKGHLESGYLAGAVA